MKKGFHLSTYILVLSFGCMLIVSCVFAISTYLSGQDIRTYEIEKSFDFRHQLLQLSLQDRLELAESRMAELASKQDLKDALSQQNRNQVEALLFEKLRQNETSFFKALFVSNSAGQTTGEAVLLSMGARYDPQKLLSQFGRDVDSWMVAFEKNTLAGMDEGVLVYKTAVPESDFFLYGIVPLNQNRQMLNGLLDVVDGYDVLLLHQQKVISSARGLLTKTEIDAIEKAKTSSFSVNDLLISQKPLRLKQGQELDVSFAIVVKRDRFAGLDEMSLYSWLVPFIAMALFGLVLALAFKRLVAKAAHRLMTFVEQVLSGDRSVHYYTGPVWELNQLGDTINQVVSSKRENERYLTNLIERANSPIIAWDGDGCVTKYNLAAEKILGIAQKDALGCPVKEILPAINLTERNNRSVLERALSGAVIDQWEMSHINKLVSQEFHISWSISPVAFKEGYGVETVLAQGQDISRRKAAEEDLRRMNEELEFRVLHRTRALEHEIEERRQMEKHLRESEERFKVIAEVSSDWFWEMGPDLRFSAMSDRALQITGVSPNSVLGKTRGQLVRPELYEAEKEKWQAHEAQLERHEPFRRFEYPIEDKDGNTRVFRISGQPVFDPKTGVFTGYVGSGRDVTEKHNRANELRRAKELAESASQAKSEFLSSMSHELRTPLNGILGFAQLMLLPSAKELDEKQRQFMMQIVQAGEHLLDLINDILDLSRIEARTIGVSQDPVMPNDVLNDAHMLIANMARDKGITLQKIACAAMMPAVCADYTRLKQVLVNLGSNAIKYNRPGGEVQLSCVMSDDGDWVEFSVEDTGLGIEEDKLDDLFIPFNRLGAEQSEVEGTGIGLTITRKLIDLMDGEMGVESRLGEGSRFWFK